MSIMLPTQFENLEPFVGKWAKGTANQRQLERLNSTREELSAFYGAIISEIEAILEFLNQYPFGDLPKEFRSLYWLTLSLAEIAPNIELYGGDTGVPHAFKETRLIAEAGEVINI